MMCSLLVAMMTNTANADPIKLTAKSSHADILKTLSGTWFGCDNSKSLGDEFADTGVKSGSMNITFVVKNGKLVNMPKTARLYTQNDCKGKPIDSRTFNVNEGFSINNHYADGQAAVRVGTKAELQNLLKKGYLEIELANNVMTGNQDDDSYTLYLSNDGKKLMIADISDDYVIFTKKTTTK